MAREIRIEQRGCLSGFVQIWKLWRHCCCRYGFFPLIVAPIVTASCLMDLYSSYDCEFISVDVGFTPSNSAWNYSRATLGLFQYQSGFDEVGKDMLSIQALMEGCRQYSEDFEDTFIEGDRTWQVARIMSFISGASSIISVLTAWLMVILPIPACFFWPGVLLPSLLVAFLCQGSKFLFLDTAICQSSLWFPIGTDSLPQQARSCSLGKTSYFSIAAGVSLFLSLLLVCLSSPQKRKLDENYGKSSQCIQGYGDNTSSEEENFQDYHMKKFDRLDQITLNASGKPIKSISNDIDQEISSFEDEGSLFDCKKDDKTDFSVEKIVTKRTFSMSHNEDIEQGLRIYEKGSSYTHTKTLNSFETQSNNGAEFWKKESVGLKDSPFQPYSRSKEETKESSTRIISQARLSKSEMMQSQSYNNNDLIEKCVMDLTESFQKR